MKRTKLILELDVGFFPEGRLDPEGYKEYLCQSDHLLSEMEIIKVVQTEESEED